VKVLGKNPSLLELVEEKSQDDDSVKKKFWEIETGKRENPVK